MSWGSRRRGVPIKYLLLDKGLFSVAVSDYLKRAKDEREQYAEQRKKVTRLVRDIRQVAEKTHLPGAIEAAAKLIVPD